LNIHFVERYHKSPDGSPELVADTSPTSSTIRELVVLLFRMFGTLFATDLKEDKAGNRFEAIVVQFLVCVEKVGREAVIQTKHNQFGYPSMAC
jgi:hypothetical protein